MSRLEKFVLRDGAPVRTWRDRVGDAWRSWWSGPYNLSTIANAFFSSPPVSSGVRVDESAAMAVSAFCSAVTLISQDVASLPLFLYKNLSGGGKEKFVTHPLNTLLHDRPNPEATSFQLRGALMLNVLTGGNAYAEIGRDASGRPAALWHVDPHRVSPFRRSAATPLQYRIANSDGGESILDASDVVHLRGPSPDGLMGLNMVVLAKEALGLSIASEKFAARYFANGAQVGGILTAPGVLPLAAAENLRKSIEARHAGSDHAHKLLLLDAGLTYTPTAVNARDSQFQELRVHQIREIARYFRLPVSLLGDLERSTYANHEQEVLKYYTSCLRPWLVSIEQEFASKLIAPSERTLQTIEHVVAGLLRADVEKRGQFYATMAQNGLMTPNEIRELENLPPLPGGDVARIPLNTAPLPASAHAHRPVQAVPELAPALIGLDHFDDRE